MKIAFYAPLKPPDHPVPSGDRRMARLLLAALALGGHQPVVASRFVSRNRDGGARAQSAIEADAADEIDRVCNWAATAGIDAWLTYHHYYKAPDLIGPAITARCRLPYLIAEPSVALKRQDGPHDAGHRATLAGLAAADAALCLTRHDIPCVLPHLGPRGRLYYLPPFLDAAAFDAGDTKPNAVPNLLVVAMMRTGDKLASYRQLAAALRHLKASDWTLTVVGDGPARGEVEGFFEFAADRTRWLGATTPDALPAIYAGADLLLWPAVNEAYGMALLEAQAAGVPVVSCATRGVPDVVDDGRTGILVAENDPPAFAAAIDRLLADPAERARFAAAARRRVRTERDIAIAARALDRILRAVAR